jgi:hypothetical protein
MWLAAWLVASALGSAAALSSSSAPYRARKWWSARQAKHTTQLPPGVKVGGAAAGEASAEHQVPTQQGPVPQPARAPEAVVFRPAIITLEEPAIFRNRYDLA